MSDYNDISKNIEKSIKAEFILFIQSNMKIEINQRKVLVFIAFVLGIIIFPLGLFELGLYLGFIKGKYGHIVNPKKDNQIQDKPIESDLEDTEVITV